MGIQSRLQLKEFQEKSVSEKWSNVCVQTSSTGEYYLVYSSTKPGSVKCIALWINSKFKMYIPLAQLTNWFM